MNRSKTYVVIMIISMLLFVITIGLIISMSQIDKQTELSTTSYIATIKNIDIIDTGKRIYTEIQTNEYDTSLQISTNISKNIKMNDVSELENGQTIFFRIENKHIGQMDKVDFIDIVSLETNTSSIFSLGEYNKYIHNAAYPTRIASIIFASLFLFISLFFYSKLKREKTGSTGDGLREPYKKQ